MATVRRTGSRSGLHTAEGESEWTPGVFLSDSNGVSMRRSHCHCAVGGERCGLQWAMLRGFRYVLPTADIHAASWPMTVCASSALEGTRSVGCGRAATIGVTAQAFARCTVAQPPPADSAVLLSLWDRRFSAITYGFTARLSLRRSTKRTDDRRNLNVRRLRHSSHAARRVTLVLPSALAVPAREYRRVRSHTALGRAMQ